MNFTTFWSKLEALEKSIEISSPTSLRVKRAYWGAPPQQMTDLPAVINTLSETDRVLGFGARDQRVRINIQLLVARAAVEADRSSEIATAFWFAAKDAFDSAVTIDGAVSFSTLRGADNTVPVILMHGGQSYIGFDSYLEIHDVGAFSF